MALSNAICRIGVFYDGSFFAYARRYYYQERDLGWLRYLPLHAFIEAFIAQEEQGYASYRVVYAAWHQGLLRARMPHRSSSDLTAISITISCTRGLSPGT